MERRGIELNKSATALAKTRFLNQFLAVFLATVPAALNSKKILEKTSRGRHATWHCPEHHTAPTVILPSFLGATEASRFIQPRPFWPDF